MTSQRLDTQTQWREPAGELKINADSQRVPLLGGRDVPAHCRWGSPPAAGCALVWVGSFQMTWIKYWMVSTVEPSWSSSNQRQVQCQCQQHIRDHAHVRASHGHVHLWWRRLHTTRLDMCHATSFLMWFSYINGCHCLQNLNYYFPNAKSLLVLNPERIHDNAVTLVQNTQSRGGTKMLALKAAKRRESL